MQRDKVIGLIIIAFSAYMYLQCLKFPPALLGTLGAGFFPKILFTLLGLAGIALTLSGFRGDKRRGASPESKTSLKLIWQSHSRVIISFVVIFIYIGAMHYFGYLSATLGFMLVLMWILSPRQMKNVPLILIISCGMTFIVYFSFLKLLQIFLPEGILF